MRIPGEITIVTERRKVAIMKGDGTERLGFFHKWNIDDFAIVENTEGRIEYLRSFEFRFLPVDNEFGAHELEKIYREIGLLKGGESHD